MLPCRFRSSISSITPHDSCRAASMNPQVFTMTRSASWPSGTSTYPSCASRPSIRSESTRFLEQPRLTKPIVPFASFGESFMRASFGDGPYREEGQENRPAGGRGFSTRPEVEFEINAKVSSIVRTSADRQAGQELHSSELHEPVGRKPLAGKSARHASCHRSPGRYTHFSCARSSTDRVADFESEGCRFESYRAHFPSPRRTANPGRVR